MPYTEVTSFNIQSEAATGEVVYFEVAVKLLSTPPDWSNLTIALRYDDGPADSLTVEIMANIFHVERGRQAEFVTNLPQPGGEAVIAGRILNFPTPGTYVLTARAGHVNGVFSEDSKLTREIIVKEVQVPPITDSMVEAARFINMVGVIMFMFMMVMLLTSLIRELKL
ncbi:MAG: hypothetical protein QXZ68_04735 [Candidatus Bathyarchaeia archaeon]